MRAQGSRQHQDPSDSSETMKDPAVPQGEWWHTLCASNTPGEQVSSDSAVPACTEPALGYNSYRATCPSRNWLWGFFPLPGISQIGTSWRYEDFSFHFSFYGIPEENWWVSSEAQGAPVITGLMLKLLPDVDTSLSNPLECWLPQKSPVSSWEGQRKPCGLLAKQLMPP